MADIGEIKPNEMPFQILHPGTDQPLGIEVGLLSINDDRMKKIKRQIQDERLKLEQRGKGFTSVQIEKNISILLFSAMTYWKWEKPLLEEERVIPAKGEQPAQIIPAVYGEQPTFHGEIPTFNQKMVFEVFEELSWFKELLFDKVGETKSFFTK